MSDRVNTARWLPNQNRWQINVQKDGQRRTFTSSKPGRTGQREANAKADAWLNTGIVSTKMTIQEAYGPWLQSLKVRTSQSNWKPLQTRWKNRVLPYIGHIKLNRITEQKLQDVIDANFADGLSRKSLSSMCCDIRAFFKFCRMSGYTSFRPECLTVPAGARNKSRKILQPDDLIKLFQCSDTSYYNRAIFDEYINAYRFQVVTGLRPGELIGLRWSDIHGDYFLIQRSFNVYGEETRGKNDNAIRSLYLFPLAKRILQDQYDAFGMQETIFSIEKEPQYYKAFKRFCRHNGITDCSLYELRHTFVSIVKVLPAGQIKPIIGHSENMDTFGVYSHAILGDSKQTASDINQIFTVLLAPTPTENQSSPVR